MKKDFESESVCVYSHVEKEVSGTPLRERSAMKRMVFVLDVLVGAVFILGVFCQSVSSLAADDNSPVWKLRERENISDVWNGVSVGFKFVPRSDAVYVAFYSYDRSMTIGRYAFDEGKWELKKLPTKIEWDSHNYVDMAFDSDGILHVSGNMHASPLVYFRASKPNDISTLERVAQMTGDRERHTTYPRFLNDKEGRTLFTYRDGSSGNGDQIWNVYDEKSRTWSRLLKTPLFDGEGQMNAYFVGPALGKDGYFHFAWVWRDSPDCATNHDLSYVRSPDLRRFENSKGEPVELPITLKTGEIVAPIPAGGGLLNPLVRLSFDQNGRPVLTYTKYDDAGNLQIWNARSENGQWRCVPCTSWTLPWRFSGGGSIPTELTFSGVSVASPTTLALSYELVKEKKRGRIFLDSETLERVDAATPDAKRTVEPRPEYSPEDAAALNQIESDDPRLLKKSTTIAVNGERWIFRWEGPDANRDRPLPDGAPEATQLRVFKFTREGERP